MGGEENLEKCRKTTFQAIAGKAQNRVLIKKNFKKQTALI